MRSVGFLVVLVALVLGACGNDSPSDGVPTLDAGPIESDAESGIGSEPLTAEDAAFEFAQCMRDNGIESFEDPVLGEGNKIGFGDGSKTADAVDGLKEGYETCGVLLEGATVAGDKDPNGTGTDQLYELAVCMRANGFDMPDPDPTGDAYADLDKSDPDFLAALDKCDEVLGTGKGG